VGGRQDPQKKKITRREDKTEGGGANWTGKKKTGHTKKQKAQKGGESKKKQATNTGHMGGESLEGKEGDTRHGGVKLKRLQGLFWGGNGRTRCEGDRRRKKKRGVRLAGEKGSKGRGVQLWRRRP